MTRIIGFFGQFVAVLALLGAGAWWLSTVWIGAVVRAFERGEAQGGWSLSGYGARLLLPVAAAWTASLAAGAAAFWMLASALDRIGPAWLSWVWWVLVLLAAVLVAAAGVFAAVSAALDAYASAKRRRILTATHPPAVPDEAGGASGAPGRRIVILCDGTGNRPDEQEDGQPATTNVWKLYRALRCDETQAAWYQAGVGSDSSSTARQVRRTRRLLNLVGTKSGARAAAGGSRLVQLFEAAFGAGISEGILNGYAEIVRQYRPGDRIYLVGFSRGAYTARCIAGVISRCGLLRAENARFAPEMVQLYRMRKDPRDKTAGVRADMVHAGVEIEFVGVFDTVASLGVPLWGWWFRSLSIWRNKAFTTDPAAACRHVYHALSMDERRSQFFPTPFAKPKDQGSRLETLRQVWFRGSHADVGGGYARTGLSDITLAWMMRAMRRHGLSFVPGAGRDLRPDPLAPLHDELSRQPSWRLFGSWPRWHPVPEAGPAGTVLHGSVLHRAGRSQRTLGRPDLHRLAAGEWADVVAQARREWDRTGIVVERGGLYRLTYLGGVWRDKEAEACGPAGQDAADRRRFLGWGRRLPRQPWMRLMATVAHPRDWPLRERSWLQLVRLLLRDDPAMLLRQLAPLGADLGRPGDSVLIRNQAPSGLLYLFANDWWLTATNNSGGVRLRLRREEREDATAPLWTLLKGGTWRRTAPVPPGAAGT